MSQDEFMDLLQVFSFILLITALFSFINCRYLKLPTSIGLMLTSMIVALCIIIVGESGFYPEFLNWSKNLINTIDFDTVVMRGMLGVLLFAGALHVNLDDLKEHAPSISLLATVGVVFSAFFFIAFVMYFGFLCF